MARDNIVMVRRATPKMIMLPNGSTFAARYQRARRVSLLENVNLNKGRHWWSFLNIHLRKEVMLFESFGFSGLNEFIMRDDKKIIKTLLYDF